jgi:dihydroorotate dehydrogenase
MYMSFDPYRILRPLLFTLPPERAHSLALSSLQFAHRLRLTPHPRDNDSEAITLMGLRFPNRVGLAAGFDKNGRYIDPLGSLGFGFIEVGTVTPRPQPGQSLPRLFRLPAHRALINRMGFPNDGMEVVAPRLARRTYPGILGINIGKNASTPLEKAVDDYVACYRKLAEHADYVAVNVSSPNTQGLRQLQQVDNLRPILSAVMEERHQLSTRLGRSVPLLAKVSPDLTQDDLLAVARLLIELNVDGVIATNTTISRPSDAGDVAAEAGGLSGAPLLKLSQHAVATLKSVAGDRLAIIGAGGIASGDDAVSIRQSGADLVQIYSGLIYRGPALTAEVRRALRSR